MLRVVFLSPKVLLSFEFIFLVLVCQSLFSFCTPSIMTIRTFFMHKIVFQIGDGFAIVESFVGECLGIREKKKTFF